MREHRQRFEVLALVAVLLTACDKAPSSPNSDATSGDHRMTSVPHVMQRLRDLIPPRFFPLRQDFTCRHEAAAVPPLDPQADQWFMQALALESPDIFESERDYRRIIQLLQAAAAKQHWKAMLNLVNLRLEGKGEQFGLTRDEEAAVQEVEAAMALNIPAAFDLMGNFYEHGIGVRPDITKAYAFYQYAAELGHPQAMTFLAEKMLVAKGVEPSPGRYANQPVGEKMLRCALAQGDGQAAFILSIHVHIAQDYSAESKIEALRLLQEGAKTGNAACAADLASQFRGFDLGGDLSLITGGIDTARAQRYRVLWKILDWYGPVVKLPNLDRVLPLPPAALPRWNGNEDDLLKAAGGVILVAPPPEPPKTQPPLPKGHSLVMPRGITVPADARPDSRVPVAGYWRPELPLYDGLPSEAWHVARSVNALPAIPLQLGAAFPLLPQWAQMTQSQRYGGLRFQYLGVPAPIERPSVPYAQAGWATVAEVSSSRPLRQGCGDGCDTTGVWVARVPDAHPAAAAFNVWWRQGWFQQGETLPGAEHWSLADAGLEIGDEAISWAFAMPTDAGPQAWIGPPAA